MVTIKFIKKVKGHRVGRSSERLQGYKELQLKAGGSRSEVEGGVYVFRL